jgi:tripartite-type tricarboxylate transporter receptor subunit TctC
MPLPYLVALFLAVFLGFAQPVAAQTWPSRAVHIVVPFPPGGSADAMARQIAAHLSEVLKSPFVVDNRSGAGGAIGADSVAKAEPDGYTLLFGSNSPLVSAKYINPKLPYDPLKDFTPVVLVAQAPLAVIVNANVPANNLQALIEMARAKPGQLSYATPGPATTGHIGGEWLNKLTGVNLVHVPYRGSAPATIDLVAGQVPIAVDSLVTNMPHIRAGKLRVLAVAARERVPDLPQVPTAREQGVDLEITLWFAIVAPAGTPRDIVTRLNRELDPYVKQSAFKKLLDPITAQAIGGSVEDAQRFLAAEAVLWKKMIESTGITTK